MLHTNISRHNTNNLYKQKIQMKYVHVSNFLKLIALKFPIFKDELYLFSF